MTVGVATEKDDDGPRSIVTKALVIDRMFHEHFVIR